MTDDIVTRLREGHGQGCKCYADYWYECACDAVWAEQYINEAADEIERLRAALKDADDDFHALKAMFDKMRNERDQLQARLGLEESGQISTVDRIADLHDQIVRLVSGYND